MWDIQVHMPCWMTHFVQELENHFVQAELRIYYTPYTGCTLSIPGRVDARSLTLEPGEMMILEYWKAGSKIMINIIMMSIIQNNMFITHIHAMYMYMYMYVHVPILHCSYCTL